MRHSASSRAVFAASPDGSHQAVRGAVERHRDGERPAVAFPAGALCGGRRVYRAAGFGFEDGEEAIDGA